MDIGQIIKSIDEYNVYISIGMLITFLILLIIVITLIVSQNRLKKKYNKFMEGASGRSLEEEIIKNFAQISSLKEAVNKINNDIDKIEENLLLVYQKIGVVKYDAFKEMGGKLSFVLVLLDKKNNGFLLNSVHGSSEGCYTYLKEIINGESFLELSNEEKKALDMAINQDNFMV